MSETCPGEGDRDSIRLGGLSAGQGAEALVAWIVEHYNWLREDSLEGE